jgi:hypothetical protein
MGYRGGELSGEWGLPNCLGNEYQINKCHLWMGAIYIKSGDKTKGCDLYQKAKIFGDEEAAGLIKGNCN